MTYTQFLHIFFIFSYLTASLHGMHLRNSRGQLSPTAPSFHPQKHNIEGEQAHSQYGNTQHKILQDQAQSLHNITSGIQQLIKEQQRTNQQLALLNQYLYQSTHTLLQIGSKLDEQTLYLAPIKGNTQKIKEHLQKQDTSSEEIKEQK